jgi:tetratricopeptide (TPR) repeat protein
MRRLVLTAAVLIGAGLLPAAEVEKLPVTRVQDLHYGDVLFQTFLGEDFEALTRLEAYDHWQLIPHHRSEAELLAGGLYLQLGMHNEAGRRFESLLAAQIPASVKSRAWFFLARVWYARGYYERCIDALERIAGTLAPAEAAERVHLQANALMHLERFDEAIALLSAWQSSSSWIHFARFNLGVALLRSGRLADGARLLDQVGSIEAGSEELRALKDKANLALGYAYLQAGQADSAMPMLLRVRLNDAQSSRALLGLGWALSALGRHEEALTPWLTLRERNLLDAAVQEAWLAVPYAFAELGAHGQAAGHYEEALASFARERDNIDMAVARIREGSLMRELVGADDLGSPQRGWFWQLSELPDAPESRYLYTVLAGHDFQEGLKNYRDLAYLGSTLARWDENMAVYGDMIAARENAYAQRTPRVDGMLASGALASVEARRKAAGGRLNDIVNRQDVAALGTAEQRERWERVLVLEALLDAQPDGEEKRQAREKLDLIKGVLQWDLGEAFRERLYQQRRQLRELDKALTEANSRWLRVQQARATAPVTTGDFADRIQALQGRLTALRARLGGAATAQQDLLAGIAIEELHTQRQRLADYEVQARFSLATIHDRAADTRPAPSGGGGP